MFADPLSLEETMVSSYHAINNKALSRLGGLLETEVNQMNQISTYTFLVPCMSHIFISFLFTLDFSIIQWFMWHLCFCELFVCVKIRQFPLRPLLWLEIQPCKMTWWWCEYKGLGERRKRFLCRCACVYGVWGEGDLRCYLLVSEACLSCTASVMLFHSSFISSNTPFSALMAQFTDTASWEGLLFGKCMCVQCYTLSYFCQVPLNCGRYWVKTSQWNYYKWEKLF